MLDKVCFYNNKIFITNNDSIWAYKYVNSESTNHFSECIIKLDLPISSNFVFKEAFLDVVENYSTQLKCLLILALSSYNEIAVFMYSPTLRSALIPLKKFNWTSSATIEPNVNLFFKPGPSLILSIDNILHIYSLLNNTKSNFDLKTCFPESNNLVSIQLCTSIRQIYVEYPINVMLFILGYGLSIDRELRAISVDVNVKQSDIPAIGKKLPLSLYFPKCFQNQVKCISVSNVGIKQNLNSNLKEADWKDNYTVLCTHQECFVFNGGKLMYLTQIAQPDTQSIHTDFCDFSKGIVSLILCSKSDNADLLNISSFGGAKLQVAKSWTSVKHVLSGDVLFNGTRHLLLMRNARFGSWKEECMVLDISSLNPVDLIRASEESSMNPAIPALQTKVQVEQSAVTKAQSEISRKLSAALEAISRLSDGNLKDTRVNHHVASFQESLVNILLHRDENRQSDVEIANPEKANLCIQKHWKTIIDSHCILCWTLSNEGKRTVCNPVINVTFEKQDMLCYQKTFIHKSFSMNENIAENSKSRSKIAFSIEDEHGKQINPGEWFSVLLSFPTPEFHSSEVKVNAVLTWHVGSAAEFENEVYLPIEDKKLTRQQMPLESDFHASDVIRIAAKDISTVEDLACIKLLQQRVVLSVRSLYSDLTDIASFLLSSAYGAAHLLLIKSVEKRCLVFKCAHSPLFGVQLTLKYLDLKHVEIEAFTKGDKQTLLLVQYLYQYLPNDILIQPIGATADESVSCRQKAVLAMKEEIDLILSSLHIHNICESITKDQVSVEAGTIVMPKQSFLRIRNALVKKEHVTDNILQKLNDFSCFKRK